MTAFNRSEYMKGRWASVNAEDRKTIMSTRRKKGAAKQTAEARSAHAKKASAGRWPKKA